MTHTIGSFQVIHTLTHTHTLRSCNAEGGDNELFVVTPYGRFISGDKWPNIRCFKGDWVKEDDWEHWYAEGLATFHKRLADAPDINQFLGKDAPFIPDTIIKEVTWGLEYKARKADHMHIEYCELPSPKNLVTVI